MPLLPKFRTEFPEAQLELILTDSNLDLVSDGIDLAIRLGPGVSGDLVGAKLFDTRYRVCASPAYLRGISRPKRPADLSGMPCLLFTFPGFRSRWLFRNRRGDISEVAVHGDLLLSNALGLRDCARAGLGPALLPDWLIDEDLAGKRLVDLFPDWQVTATTFDTAAYMLYPNRAFLPVKVRRTIDFLRRHLAKQVNRARR
ncbi:substrate binding domain-containing protein [Bradyrhizobium guangxiense]